MRGPAKRCSPHLSCPLHRRCSARGTTSGKAHRSIPSVHPPRLWPWAIRHIQSTANRCCRQRSLCPWPHPQHHSHSGLASAHTRPHPPRHDQHQRPMRNPQLPRFQAQGRQRSTEHTPTCLGLRAGNHSRSPQLRRALAVGWGRAVTLWASSQTHKAPGSRRRWPASQYRAAVELHTLYKWNGVRVVPASSKLCLPAINILMIR